MADRASTAPRWRSRMTRKPVAVRANQNTRRGRRLADLFHALMDRVGNPTDIMMQADVLRAAELRIAAEDLRAKVLAGGERVGVCGLPQELIGEPFVSYGDCLVVEPVLFGRDLQRIDQRGALVFVERRIVGASQVS